MNPAPNLVLVGPMGAGKSSLGRRLASRLGLEFADADPSSNSRPGEHRADLRSTRARPASAPARNDCWRSCLQGTGLAIATGGGAVLSAATREALRARAFVVHVQVGVEQQAGATGARHRAPAAGERRPPRNPARAGGVTRPAVLRRWRTMAFTSDGLGVDDAARRLATAAVPAMAAERGGMSRVIRVELGARAYEVEVGSGLLASPRLAAQVPGAQAFVLSDANVAPLYLAKVQAALAASRCMPGHSRPASRRRRCARFGEAMQALARAGASRDATVHRARRRRGRRPRRLRRGLLDARRALRAAADHAAGDGRFLGRRQDRGRPAAGQEPGRRLPPAAAVFADLDTLATLPARELRAGLAEVVKAAAIADAGFFAWLEAHAEGLLAGDDRRCSSTRSPPASPTRPAWSRATSTNAANACCSTSATPSATRSRPRRATAGCCTARRWRSAWCWRRTVRAAGARPAADAQRLQALLRGSACHRAAGRPAAPELLARMRLDKKAVSGVPRLVLWRGIGQAEVVRDVTEDALLRALA
jgi:3-dehydroquinate synthase